MTSEIRSWVILDASLSLPAALSLCLSEKELPIGGEERRSGNPSMTHERRSQLSPSPSSISAPLLFDQNFFPENHNMIKSKSKITSQPQQPQQPQKKRGGRKCPSSPSFQISDLYQRKNADLYKKRKKKKTGPWEGN